MIIPTPAASLHPNLTPSKVKWSLVLAIDDLLGLEVLSSGERATRVYGLLLLRMLLDIPVEAPTKTPSHLTTAVDFLI